MTTDEHIAPAPQQAKHKAHKTSAETLHEECAVVNLLHPDKKHVVHVTADNVQRFLTKGYTVIEK